MNVTSANAITLSLGPVELIPSIAVGEISDFGTHVTQQHQMGNKSGFFYVFCCCIFGKNKVLALHWYKKYKNAAKIDQVMLL